MTGNMALGEFYKELRLARKIKQKEVAKGNLTASQLSKFELGQSMLSADKLFQAVEGINMTFAEFGHALNNYEDSPCIILGNQISELYFEKNIKGLEELLDNLNNGTLYDHLMTIIIKNAIFSLDSTKKLPPEDIETLTEYLYAIESWTTFELYLFASATSALVITDLIFLGRFLIERTTLYKTLHNNKRLFKNALLNIISTLIEQQELKLVEFFIAQLEKHLTYEDLYLKVILEFLRLFYKQIISDISNIQHVENYVESISFLKTPELTDILMIKLKQYKAIYKFV